jgi:hypothetical protein
MKILILSVALATAIAITGDASAQDLTKALTKEDCEKAGGAWNVQSNQCAEESAKMGKEEGTHQGAHLNTTPKNETQKIDQPDSNNPTTSN